MGNPKPLTSIPIRDILRGILKGCLLSMVSLISGASLAEKTTYFTQPGTAESEENAVYDNTIINNTVINNTAITPSIASFDEQKPDKIIVQRAREALAKTLTQKPNKIKHISTAAVDWRDSSLGCPQPGFNYLQVVTPGHKVILVADNQKHAIHLSKKHAIVCEYKKLPAMSTSKDIPVVSLDVDKTVKKTVPAKTAPINTIPMKAYIQQAIDDLATKEEVAKKAIRIVSLKPLPSSMLQETCGKDGQNDNKAKNNYYLITLTHKKESYNYITNNGKVVFCNVDKH